MKSYTIYLWLFLFFFQLGGATNVDAGIKVSPLFSSVLSPKGAKTLVSTQRAINHRMQKEIAALKAPFKVTRRGEVGTPSGSSRGQKKTKGLWYKKISARVKKKVSAVVKSAANARKHAKDFYKIYHVDAAGNSIKNKGTTYTRGTMRTFNSSDTAKTVIQAIKDLCSWLHNIL